MYRVELKDGIGIEIVFNTKVPNVPCGVESSLVREGKLTKEMGS